ncbi:MAG: tRNA (adenosine(37)-N6)-threonylcarbamoyltransferase complex dimerization subunit type 1 TsaB [Bacteroidetes bacterium]|nr:tRNA (adenosine(37)-N6)-threonylcarbamoyltransferase complex dimerization subunit type 1 TsaB [Bacteroidota bacterium]
MSLILSIETSTKVCSVALHKQGTLVAHDEIIAEKSHAEILTILTKNIISGSGFNFNQIDAIAISKGPGSYTGLRIGTSTAKGLCYALEKPLIAINTLQAMAYEIINLHPEYSGSIFNLQSSILCPMLDARRMEVYYAMFNASNEFIKDTSAEIMDEFSFKDVLPASKVIFFGEGMDKCKPILSKHENAIFLDDIFPSAKNIGYLATSRYKENDFEDVAYFEPFYLKDFVSISR